MKTLTILLFFIFVSSTASAKQYESYSEIVDRLSSYRAQQLRSKISTTVPRQKYSLSLGYTQGFVPIDFAGIGTVSSPGISFGGAMPIISQQLFVEAFGKFYETEKSNNATASVKQVDLRVVHKESMDFAIMNFGFGASSKFIDIDTATQGGRNLSVPSLSFMVGVERQITNRISLVGDLSYHRSIRSSQDANNSYETTVRMNYSL